MRREKPLIKEVFSQIKRLMDENRALSLKELSSEPYIGCHAA